MPSNLDRCRKAAAAVSLLASIVGALGVSLALSSPAHAGTNTWTSYAPCAGPYTRWADALACADAVTPSPGSSFLDCGVATVVWDGTGPDYEWQSRAYYDSSPQNGSVCTPLEWTPRNFSFADSCATMSPARSFNATFGGCAQSCVAPDTLNMLTGLCDPEAIAPTTPTGLSATPTRGAITLTWSASTDNVAVTGYSIERCLGAACSNFAAVATTASTTRQESGLPSNTTYRYRARAFDAAGNHSAYSAIAEATTPAVSAEYVYDELGRVVLLTIASGASIVYAYDESGNVTAIVRAAP